MLDKDVQYKLAKKFVEGQAGPGYYPQEQRTQQTEQALAQPGAAPVQNPQPAAPPVGTQQIAEPTEMSDIYMRLGQIVTDLQQQEAALDPAQQQNQITIENIKNALYHVSSAVQFLDELT